MALTDAEIDEMFEGYLKRKAAKSSTRGRKKKKAIAAQDDYESMSLTEFSGQLSDSMGDCTQLSLDSFFEMERASKKGRKLEAAGHGIKGAIGVGLVAYGFVELLSAAFGGRD
ncbi:MULTISPECIES: hypothetical protein [Pseudanabaena]|uniref:hypothetical protein n=1 Tax=Pseudanabaena TaxID=1152 RepID=UPI0024785AAC|nr:MULTISPECIES: hypothetical protein [Pseudanabaena]MEA5485636.1 hypothetical protein [Pseudanabaena sp. CCNP1317]WGS71980.1 hypothetical protein OA858_20090 [Pseudanabaena galeata CCNP1313]